MSGLPYPHGDIHDIVVDDLAHTRQEVHAEVFLESYGVWRFLDNLACRRQCTR